VSVSVEIVTPAATNNISSTLVRKQLRENHSVKYLVPDAVAEYVAAEQLATYSQWQ
jgi:nicotinic acid mononucleotide adenylyltransferase